MRAYAKQAKNRQLETQAAEIRFRAERRIGELMAAQRDAGMLATGAKGLGINQHEVRVASGPTPPTLSDVGIDKHLFSIEYWPHADYLLTAVLKQLVQIYISH